MWSIKTHYTRHTRSANGMHLTPIIKDSNSTLPHRVRESTLFLLVSALSQDLTDNCYSNQSFDARITGCHSRELNQPDLSNIISRVSYNIYHAIQSLGPPILIHIAWSHHIKQHKPRISYMVMPSAITKSMRRTSLTLLIGSRRTSIVPLLHLNIPWKQKPREITEQAHCIHHNNANTLTLKT